MSVRKRICANCGKSFVPCGKDFGAFNYRNVCCSDGCARKYMTQMLKAKEEQQISSEASADEEVSGESETIELVPEDENCLGNEI